MPNKEFSVRSIIWVITALTLFGTATRAVAQQERVLHSFNDDGRDGIRAYGGLICDEVGNLYGTTQSGGTYGVGTVFELTPRTGGGFGGKILHSFDPNGKDGVDPTASLTLDASGNLYGTASQGGHNYGGVVFELMPQATGKWTEAILHAFESKGTGPQYPVGSVALDASGNVYGVTVNGGTSAWGTVFELSQGSDGEWTEQTIHNFGSEAGDGEFPEAGVVLDVSGNLYGTTFAGGSQDSGTVFELTPTTGGVWAETILHSFEDNNTDGYGPYAGVTFDASGNLYGTTFEGGSGGDGVAFKLTAAEGWTETIIHNFIENGTDGYHPIAGVILDGLGNVYGTTGYGGIYSSVGLYFTGGIVYKLTNKDGSWTEKILHDFGSGLDANVADGGLAADVFGNLYGATIGGGTYGYGAVYSIKP